MMAAPVPVPRWNDEGETQWFTYTWWNKAQSQVAAAARPGKRFFTINRCVLACAA